MITTYCLCHGLWTVIPHQLEANRPDHLAIYYCGANNEYPEAVHEVTRRLMRTSL